MTTPRTGLQPVHLFLQSNGDLTLSLVQVLTPAPGPNEVVVRVDAAPINPSDLGLMLAGADISKALVWWQARAAEGDREGSLERRAPQHDRASFGVHGSRRQRRRAGVVIEAGLEPCRRRRCSARRSRLCLPAASMYSKLHTATVDQCLRLPDDATAAEGASAFVNPLTALSMLEAMRREGHTALVHTAAGSNLGQMLVRLCLKDGVELVNIVRKPEQEKLLRALGAKHVVSSESPTFMNDLIAAVTATGATIAFDAIGGGKLASQILTAMEAAASAKETKYNRYGSSTHKQVYIYGSLDRGPTELARTFGLAWGIGGWLVTPFLQKVGELPRRKRQASAGPRAEDFDVGDNARRCEPARRGASTERREACSGVDGAEVFDQPRNKAGWRPHVWSSNDAVVATMVLCLLEPEKANRLADDRRAILFGT